METLNLIRSDIKLIQDQVTGNYEQMDLSSIPRTELEKAVKVYSEVIRDLQHQLETTTLRLAEFEKKAARY
jgi:hypothetical protein